MGSYAFVPKEIKVGYDERSDTYTKKLAYVIYYDEKGVLRKETSWNSWRDNSLGEDNFENIPTEGFVLNKKAGGYMSHWNMRQTYVRVYDPRGFEIEITVPNLLYILENTNSIKGKGLEGEFVYAWDGTELILVPTSAPDYKTMIDHSEKMFQGKNLKIKDLIPGATYVEKDGTKRLFLGRYNKYGNTENKGKYLFWIKFTPHGTGGYLDTTKSLSKKIASIEEETMHPLYSEIMEMLSKTNKLSPIVKIEQEDISGDEVLNHIQRSRHHFYPEQGLYAKRKDFGDEPVKISVFGNYRLNIKDKDKMTYKIKALDSATIDPNRDIFAYMDEFENLHWEEFDSWEARQCEGSIYKRIAEWANYLNFFKEVRYLENGEKEDPYFSDSLTKLLKDN